uniref:Uncharacterized protein n=1 Tax=Ralstonia solanacearum TaxID=305 RepID=A0A0S4TUE6_RALSL|nr:protein of unknown function [Ralstonia solanacearum]
MSLVGGCAIKHRHCIAPTEGRRLGKCITKGTHHRLNERRY